MLHHPVITDELKEFKKMEKQETQQSWTSEGFQQQQQLKGFVHFKKKVFIFTTWMTFYIFLSSNEWLYLRGGEENLFLQLSNIPSFITKIQNSFFMFLLILNFYWFSLNTLIVVKSFSRLTKLAETTFNLFCSF